MKYLIPVLAFFLLTSLVACSGNNNQESNEEASTTTSENNSSEENTDEQPTDIASAMKQAQKALEQVSGGEKVDPVNFRELQTVLPDQLSGMEQTDKSGQTTGTLGYNISQAEAEYKTSDGKSVKVGIVDTGGFAAGLMGMAAWASLTIDKEDSNGFERSTTINGFKAFEKYNKRSNRSEISLLVDNRFVVKVEGRDVGMDELRDMLSEMSLNKLSNLGK
ncbi:MAG: hypothetical protein DHS20C18_07380 [Saprospiraceae bacterium]|nr:MAG: hypothetical protein DHS20C18_07380 [Saprospiraceae bacterium]